MWFLTSEISQDQGGSFETLTEFNVEPNSTFDIPMKFKPKYFGKHQVLSVCVNIVTDLTTCFHLSSIFDLEDYFGITK